MLCAQPVLPRLRSLQVKVFCRTVARFLQVYGAQLRHFSYDIPDSDANPPQAPNLISSCPNLESIVWVVRSRNKVQPIRHLPLSHLNIRTVTIVYCKPEPFAPATYSNQLQQYLFATRTGHYPSVREVVVVLTGTGLPDIEQEYWFTPLKSQFAQRGVSLRLVFSPTYAFD
ncbi:hypothetical protein NMY22_g4061 [Coprinellus aureogranulatus]|nr:hypothetical protein NMY22_g4061 [Coprinellus aureogranulatus]